MTLTIPTGDFTGVLSDAIPFADPSKDSSRHAVKVWWDGRQFHAEACSGPHWGRSTWDPDDERKDDRDPQDRQESLLAKWGSGDAPWQIVIDLPDAKELVKIYRLSGKGVYYVPLHLDHLGESLRVLRHKDSGHSAITTVVAEVFTAWPDIDDLMHLGEQEWAPVDGLLVNAHLLANFGDVRQRDSMRMRFTGERSPVHVTIGDRFVGAIMPHREPERLAAVPATEPKADADDRIPF